MIKSSNGIRFKLYTKNVGMKRELVIFLIRYSLGSTELLLLVSLNLFSASVISSEFRSKERYRRLAFFHS